MRVRHVALATAVMAIWGLNFVVIEVGLDSLPPLLFAALRFVVAAVPAVFFVGRPCVEWRWIVAIGLTIGVGQFGLLFTGMHFGMPAGLSSLIMQSQAPFTILLAALVLHERIRLRQLAGLGLALIGFVAIGVDLDHTAPALAFGMCITAALMWACGNLAIRKSKPRNLLNLMVWVSLVPPIPLLGLSLLIEGPRADLAALRELSWQAVGAVFYIGYLATLFGFGTWGWLMRQYTAGSVAVYSLLVPIFGMSTAALLLGEEFGWVRLVAAAFVLAGVALATLNGRRPARPVAARPPPVSA